ncbi:MAG TPA: TIGR03619 family F420-dependent LLM class oxidoreductase, partial [Acidimicrobiia bacterium]
MKVSLGLPTHQVGGELAAADGIAEVSVAAETAGFDAVFVTDHPFPSDRWLATGGHHALDPFVALSFAAAATTRLRLHTNLLVLAYRNPFHSAKAIASLDVLSNGRVIVGVGAGYLEAEFEALGVDFDARNDLTDDAIAAMRTAWTGESVAAAGRGWRAPGNTMQPVPT